LAPDRFYASEYYRSYYSQTRLAEEVGFFVPLAGNDALVLSLMRLRATGPFGTADARLLRDMAPAVIGFCKQRWPALPADEAAVRPSDETVAMPNEL
ncbi:helix-turn-helix transcriptional regulator, partial [bacterium M00.F.Ca.ET.177.01.1.1]